jgi:ribonuclease BN (tRNA processing enzyme)
VAATQFEEAYPSLRESLKATVLSPSPDPREGDPDQILIATLDDQNLASCDLTHIQFRVILGFCPPTPPSPAILWFSEETPEVSAYLAGKSCPCFRADRTVLLYCLGAGGYYPTPVCQTMCWFVPELGIIFDAGTGLSGAASLVATDVIDVFLSHGHLDHIMGVCLARRCGGTTRIRAQPHVIAGVQLLSGQPFWHFPAEFEYCPIEDLSPIRLENGAVVTPFEVPHTDPCLGFRLDYREHSMCYVTDSYSTAESAHVEAIRGTRVLVHECYRSEAGIERAQTAGHCVPSGVVGLCNAAGITDVVLAHLNPNGNAQTVGEEVRAKIPKALVAADGTAYEF